MKIIDCEAKGNLIRLYLGRDGLDDWTGDDWDDAPCDCNAGRVYDEYVADVMDVAVPWRLTVLEPEEGAFVSRDDVKARRLPLFVVAPPSNGWGWTPVWAEAVGDDRALRVYMGDGPEGLLALPGVVRMG